METDWTEEFSRCADLIAQADGLLITAGAGLGVDSGLPDFRGSGGLWRAYPALGRARLQFAEIANPAAFRTHPRLAWGFYGHRLRLYRRTTPGPAFGILKSIASQLPAGARIFTSNVDGHFQKAGFDPRHIVECHGSIHHLQCMTGCRGEVWPADDFEPEVDEAACLLLNAAPVCPWCTSLARPNILMFGDADWIDTRTQHQYARYASWRSSLDRLLVIEIGAGTAVPSVRLFGEQQGTPLIRINPDDASTAADRGVSLPMSGIAALRGIEAALRTRGFLAD